MKLLGRINVSFEVPDHEFVRNQLSYILCVCLCFLITTFSYVGSGVEYAENWIATSFSQGRLTKRKDKSIIGCIQGRGLIK